MISKKLMQSMTFNDFLSDRVFMDVPVDTGDDEVVVTVLCVVDVRAGVWTSRVINIDVTIVTRVSVIM